MSLNLRPTDGYESSIEVMWRASDLVECLIFFGLAIMLAYTTFVTVRFFRRYFLARRESFGSFADYAPASEQSKKNLVADLSRGVGTLRSIASAAPFLGVAGTCYGILCLFSRGRIGPRADLITAISSELSTALVATAAGLIVAIPAAISYNVLRLCLERFENTHSSMLLEAVPRSYGFAQTLPLRNRFSAMPAFALIAAPVLALLIPMFAIMSTPPTPVGLRVHLLKIGVADHDAEPILISVIGPRVIRRGVVGEPSVYVNSKEITWDELGSALRSQLKVRQGWSVYVAGEDGVAWRDVVYAIDTARGLDAEVVLLTPPPAIHPSTEKNKKKERPK